MQVVPQERTAINSAVAVKDTEIEHLRITISCLCGPRLARIRFRISVLPPFDSQRCRRSLGKGRDVNDASLVCVFIGRTGATGSDSAEMVLRTAKRNADDRCLSIY